MEVLISGGLERHRKPGDYVNEASYTRNKTKNIEVVFKERRMYDIIFLVGSDSFVLNIKTFRVINCSVKLILVGCRGAACRSLQLFPANQNNLLAIFPRQSVQIPEAANCVGYLHEEGPSVTPPPPNINPSQPLPLKHPTSVQLYTDLPSFQSEASYSSSSGK